MSRIRKNWLLFQITAMLIALVLSLTTPLAAFASTLSQQKASLELQQKQKAADLLKQKQQAALIQSDITTVNSQIYSTEQSVSQTVAQINATQATINQLQTDIGVQEDKLAAQQDRMGKIIASWYMEGQSGLLEAMVSSNSLSDIVDKEEYYDSIRQQLETEIANIEKIKNDLSSQKATQDRQLTSLKDLEQSQIDQQNYLQGRKSLKNSLLSGTQSAITQLAAEQADIQSQIAAVTKKIEDAYRAAGGGGSSKGPNIHGTPNMPITYYSQNDSRWASKTLGADGPNLDAAGCLITSLAMVGTSLGLSYTPGTLTDASSFSDRTNSSSASWGNFRYFDSNITGLSNYQSREGLDYAKIDSELSKGYPVIVGVNIASGHWIVLTGGSRGNYSWYDPYTRWENQPNYNNSSFFAMRTYD